MPALAVPHPYIVLGALAFFVAWCVQPVLRLAPPSPGWARLALPAALLLGCLGGARLPVVLASADWVANGGTITTALAVGYVMVEVTRAPGLLPPAARDEVAWPLALALVVVRFGCFADGCCRGAASSVGWAVDFGDGVPRHPTQLYESGFHVLCAAVIFALLRRGLLRGEVLRLYLAAYCVFRFATEWVRLEPRAWLGLTFSQVVVALMGAALLALWGADLLRVRRPRPPARPARGPRTGLVSSWA